MNFSWITSNRTRRLNHANPRITIIVGNVIFCVGVIVQIATMGDKWYQIAVGRWVAGLGVGMLSVLTPMYVLIGQRSSRPPSNKRASFWTTGRSLAATRHLLIQISCSTGIKVRRLRGRCEERWSRPISCSSPLVSSWRTASTTGL